MRGAPAVLIGLTLIAACSASESPTPSIAPTAAAPLPSAPDAVSPTPEPGIGVDSWVEVAVDRLHLRSAAGTGNEWFGYLPSGTVGQIAGGPVTADGYTWYALAGPGLSYETGCLAPTPPLIDCPGFFGWVAAADLDGTPWLVAADPQCPAVPTTIDAFVHLQPGVSFACFSEDVFALDGYVAPIQAGRGCYQPFAVTPSWLHPCTIQFMQGVETEIEGQGPELAAHLHPSAGVCDFGGRSPPACPYLQHVGQWIEVEGHYDDPAAATCAAEVGSEPGYPLPEPVHLVYQCRSSFVVTSINPAE